MSLIRLEFLTQDDTLQRLCKRYWEFDKELNFIHKVADLSNEFNIPYRTLNKVVTEYSNAYSTEELCSSCGSPYVYSSRSDFQQRHRWDRKSWICPDCTDKLAEQQKAEKVALEQRRRKIIEEAFDLSNTKPVDLLGISFEDAVCLLSLVRLGASEDLSFIRPLWTIKDLLAPTDDMQYAIIKQLYQQHLIFVHPTSSPDAFEFEGDVVKLLYLDRVTWALSETSDGKNSKELISELERIFRNMEWPDRWYDEQLPFWKKLALHECLQYLKVTLDDHGFSLNPGEKTLLVFNNLLETYSVAQIFNFIWRAAKDAAAFYVRERVPKQHAANTVVGSIQRQAEHALAEKWDVKPYRRDRRCPQSMVGQVLFNTVLQIGDEGFNSPPR